MNLIVLFLLFVVNTSATTLFTTFGDLNQEQIGIEGDMFDLCAKTNVEITSFDIHCYCTNGAYSVTTEIYVATATNQTYFDIKTSSIEWTLIHNQSINCAGLGSLTDLSTFNKNSAPIMIKDSNCRGFYATVPSITSNIGCWLSNTAYDSNYEGTVYVSDSAIEIKVGRGMYYPFNDPDSLTRLWNGQVHYNIPTVSPTNNPIKTYTTNDPTNDPTMTPSEHPTNILTSNAPTSGPTYTSTTPTFFPSSSQPTQHKTSLNPTNKPIMSPLVIISTYHPTAPTLKMNKIPSVSPQMDSVENQMSTSTSPSINDTSDKYYGDGSSALVVVVLVIVLVVVCMVVVVIRYKYMQVVKQKQQIENHYVQLVDKYANDEHIMTGHEIRSGESKTTLGGVNNNTREIRNNDGVSGFDNNVEDIVQAVNLTYKEHVNMFPVMTNDGEIGSETIIDDNLETEKGKLF